MDIKSQRELAREIGVEFCSTERLVSDLLRRAIGDGTEPIDFAVAMYTKRIFEELSRLTPASLAAEDDAS